MPGVNTTRVQACIDLLNAVYPHARGQLMEMCLERLRLFTSRMLNRSKIVRDWEPADDVLQTVNFRLDRLHREFPIYSAHNFLCLAAANGEDRDRALNSP